MMDKKTAEEAMRIISNANAALNDLTILSLTISDESEQISFRKILVKAMGAINFDLIAHICKQYPDLDPDK